MASAKLFSGTGSPNGVVFANPGDLYQNESSPGEVWIKETGVGTSTGWGALVSSSGAAVVFDDAVPGTRSNIRENRAANQSPIDNTKSQITNLGSQDGTQDPGATGATGVASTIGGGDDNTASGDYSTVVGGGGSKATDQYATAGGNAFAQAPYSTAFGAGVVNPACDYGSALGAGNARSQYATAAGAGNVQPASDYGTSLGATQVTGQYTTAAGSAIVSGDYATGFGAANVSSQYGMGAGATNIAAASDFSAAFGQGTVTGDHGFIAGESDVNGSHSTALGDSSATGDRTTALGNSIVSGDGATGSGFSNATAEGAIAMGGSNASGEYSTALGASLATGDFGVALGNGCQATGVDGAVALGNGCRAVGDDGCIAAGNGCRANGDSSAAFCNGSIANGDSAFAAGNGSLADGNYSTALCSSVTDLGSDYSCALNSSRTSAVATLAHGETARPTRESQHSFASGQFTAGFANWGEVMTSKLVFRGQTPGLAPGESTVLKFGDFTGGGSLEFIPQDGRGYSITVQLIARGNIGGLPNVQSIKQTFAVRRTAGVTTIAAAVAAEQVGDAASASWAFTLSVGVAPDRLVLTFSTGATTSAVKIAAEFKFVEIATP
jgi:hypothetical protein